MGGKNGGIFEEWFKNIGILIFMQSFHAIFLVFIMEIVRHVSISDSLDKWSINDGMLAIISMVAMLALIKMEKMIKGIFGIKDSKFMGNIGENFAKGMAGIKSAGNMAARTVEPAKRTAKLVGDKVRNNKEITDAKEKAASKQKTYDDLVKAGPSGSHMNRKQYMEKLKEARQAAEEAHKDVATKQEKGRKLTTDIKHSAVQTGSTFGSSIAAGAFGIGATDTIAEAAIVANMTDKVLDSVANPALKNTVYGKAARQQQQHIEELPQKMAEEEVGRRYGLKKGDAGFDEKVRLTLDDANFKKQIKSAVDAALDTKFELDMEIPSSKLRQLGKVMGDTWKEGAGAFSADSRAGRSYSRNIRKNGIEYKGTNVSNVDDI